MKRVISTDGTQLVSSTVGDGPDLVMVLGALNTRKSGSNLAKLLAQQFTVTNYDRRGRGGSTDATSYDPEREVEDLAAVLSDLKSPAYLYGHSSGAAIVLRAAVELAASVEKVAIYEAPYVVTGAEIAEARAYQDRLAAAERRGDSSEAVALFMAHVGVSEKQVAAMRGMPMWKGLVAMGKTLTYDSAVLGAGHALSTVLPQLKQVNRPTLVMHGSRGAPAMRAAAVEIAAAVPDAQFLTVDGQDHGVSPTAIAPILTDFFLAPR